MKKFKKLFFDYIYIIIGSFIIALAINVFLVPFKISTGGISGIAMILLYVFKIPLSVTNIVLNAILFMLGYKLLNKNVLTKTIIGIISLSVFLEITLVFGTYTEDILIASLFGGILVGVGVGLVVIKEASTGGSDFAALMIHRKMQHISLAKIIFVIDFIVILSSGIVFENYTILFYSLISLYICSKVADYILISGDYAKSVYIISSKSDEVAKLILNDVGRGVTGIYSKGYYCDKDSTMLMCIVRAKEVPHILNLVKECDNDAFIIVSEVREVRGEGFKEI